MSFTESQIVELKPSTSQLRRGMESLCAFANTDLGTVYFGINNNGDPIGFQISDRTFKDIQNECFTQFDPKIYPNIYQDEVDGKDIMIVELKNTPERPYFYRGKAYKRVGTSNTIMSQAEIQRMMYERQNPEFQYDRSTLPSTSADLNKEKIKWFYNLAHVERNLPLEDSPDTLSKLNILSGDNPNVAGILAFGNDIPKYNPTAFIKCAVFEGLDKTGRMLDHLDIKSDIFSQIDQAENFVLRNIRKHAEVNNETGRRESRYEIPYRTIREAIANAIAHRDYRISSTIDVAIFDDRIEIWSPGNLPDGITIDTLYQPHKSILRNSTIAELLYLVRYIERWGTGFQNMKKWMLEYGLPEPEVRIHQQTTIVTLQRETMVTEEVHPNKGWENIKKGLVENIEKGLVENAWKVLEQTWYNPKITINEIASTIGTSTTTVDKHIAKLKNYNLLERIGGDRGGVWMVHEIKQENKKTDND